MVTPIRARWLLLGGGIAALVVGWRILPAISYSDTGPTRVGHFFVRLWAGYARLGLPPSWSVALEVRGRNTGLPRTLPLVVGHHGDDDFVVSMLGERAEWVRNVRAANGEAVVIHGERRPVRLIEVPADQRAPILKAYLSRAIGGRPHIPVAHDAPVAAFEPIAAEYPVFRIEDR